MLHGIIVVNPFLVPAESIHQANRMKDEFDKLNVETEIVSDLFLKNVIENGNIKSYLGNVDFAVYFDKDKYQSKILTDLGVRLFNSHDAIRVCDDKGETYIALSDKGINLPKTIFAPLCYRNDLHIIENSGKKIADELGFPVIVKESYGSMGKGIYKADNLSELIYIMDKVKLKPHLFQQYLGKKPGVDIRIIVIGNKAVASMERRNTDDFRSNVARGGVGTKVVVPQSFLSMAEKVSAILGLDYCGVDILYGDNDEPFICEVNSNAFFGGIEKATNVNVAKLYSEHIINKLNK